MSNSFDRTRHPRNRSGQFEVTAGDGANGIADGGGLGGGEIDMQYATPAEEVANSIDDAYQRYLWEKSASEEDLVNEAYDEQLASGGRVQPPIRCGNCSRNHFTAAEVKACYAGTACTWLVPDGRADDGMYLDRECGAPTTTTDNGQGFRCENGHSHVSAQTRFEQGWEYAEDDEEAKQLTKNGVEPRNLVTGESYQFS